VDGTINVIDIATSKVRFSIKHAEAFTKILWNPKQPFLVGASVDGLLQVWDGRTGELLKTFKGHQNSILDFDIRADGLIAVTAGDDGVSLVFSLA
jgi:ribosome assembly protein SQT1